MPQQQVSHAASDEVGGVPPRFATPRRLIGERGSGNCAPSTIMIVRIAKLVAPHIECNSVTQVRLCRRQSRRRHHGSAFFHHFWRGAAIVLSDLASSVFYAGGIAEQAIGKSAPWFVLGVMLFSFAVRSVYMESCSMFVRGGVYVVVRDSMGRSWPGCRFPRWCSITF